MICLKDSEIFAYARLTPLLSDTFNGWVESSSEVLEWLVGQVGLFVVLMESGERGTPYRLEALSGRSAASLGEIWANTCSVVTHSLFEAIPKWLFHDLHLPDAQ